MAIEEGSGEYNGQRLLVGKTDRVVSDQVREVTFGEELDSPLFYAQDQQTFGGDTSWVRLVELYSDRAEIRIQEEQSANVETTHITEIVGWMAIGLGANAPSPNILPIADAGDTQTVIAGADVTLDGSGSGDSDGSIVGYVWTDDGLEVGAGVNPVLSGLAVGEHTIELLVTDNDGGTATDIVVIVVNDIPNIVGPQVDSSESFTLNQPTGDAWTEIGFTESFSAPPVVIPSVLTSNDADPAEVMLSDLTVDGVCLLYTSDAADE